MLSHKYNVLMDCLLSMTRVPAIGVVFAALLLPALALEAEPIGFSMNGLELTSLDLDTGSFSTVGSVGVNQVAGAAFGFDGYVYAVSELSDELWRVDSNTGMSSLVGAIGVDVGAESGLTPLCQHSCRPKPNRSDDDEIPI